MKELILKKKEKKNYEINNTKQEGADAITIIVRINQQNTYFTEVLITCKQCALAFSSLVFRYKITRVTCADHALIFLMLITTESIHCMIVIMCSSLIY